MTKFYHVTNRFGQRNAVNTDHIIRVYKNEGLPTIIRLVDGSEIAVQDIDYDLVVEGIERVRADKHTG